MRTWVYSWKSPDGLRHEGEMGAPNKDAVYAALREKGIRAIKVTERIQPVVKRGLKGLRKRDVSFLVTFALCLAGGAWYLATRSVTNKVETPASNQTIKQPNNLSAASSSTRNMEFALETQRSLRRSTNASAFS